ncbi:MAG: hypothetical protein JOZ52_14470 [Acidobacteria bacterium]|nr:hypothetical protein [Acidobacteriota bacterium]
MNEAKRELLRHAVATIAYRGAKMITDAPESFSYFKASETTRTPLEILAHMGDLFDWAVSLCEGEHVWRDTTALNWEQQSARFFSALKAFDDYLASDAPLGFSVEKLFQGPIADALTHVGQLALLRRMAGSPVRGENYFKAQIEAGRVSSEQSSERVEFE